MTTVKPSEWLAELPKYPFVHLRDKKNRLREKGVGVIDFSIGDPTAPTPGFIVKSAAAAMEKYRGAGYPDNRGTGEFRRSLGKWFYERFGVRLDAEREIFPSLGAKEAVFSFPSSLEGELIIVPTPGYPPYYSGALAAGKEVYLAGLYEKNGFLPDLSAIPDEVARRAAVMWINYPNNPTTALASETFFRELLEFCKSYGIIIASDECYSEMYRREKPRSILQYAKEGVIVFQSLSKRSNMTGWRIGCVAGDADIVGNFLRCKENMDSGCANFIQEAAAAALSDETHVEEMRREYNEKREILKEAIRESGLREGYSDSAFYIWQPTPEGMTANGFADALLEEECALVVTPGPALAVDMPDGSNAGEGFVRFALVPTVEDTKEAARRLIRACSNMKKSE